MCCVFPITPAFFLLMVTLSVLYLCYNSPAATSCIANIAAVFLFPLAVGLYSMIVVSLVSMYL